MDFQLVKLAKGKKNPVTDEWEKNPIPINSDFGKILLERVSKGYVNYGIHAGASDLLIVDVDPKNGGDPQKYLDTWPKTKTVRTPSGGYHFYYHWDGSKDLSGQRKPEPGVDFIVGMAQAVGPGSSISYPDGEVRKYELLDNTPVAELPQFAIGLVLACEVEKREKTPNVLAGDPTPEGRNNALTAAMGIARKMGLVDNMVAAFAHSMNNLLPDPLPKEELDNTIIKSAMQWQAGEDEEILIKRTAGETGICSADDLPEIGVKPIRWVVDDFVPEGELTIVWGGPKVGKSTWCAWVAACASRQQKRVLFVGAGEERAEIFAAKYRESGGDMDYFDFWGGAVLKFPKYAKYFTDEIRDKGYGFVYFDSLRSIMEADPKKNEADRSRDALQPIAAMAQEVGTAIMLTTHPMKSRPDAPEIMLGSGELIAVARCVLHAKLGSSEDTFFVSVDRTNGRKPDVDLQVIRGEQKLTDHRTGAVQIEIRENGEQRLVTIPFIESVERVAKGGGYVDTESHPSTDDSEERYQAFKAALEGGELHLAKDAEAVLGFPVSDQLWRRYKNRMHRDDTQDIRISRSA